MNSRSKGKRGELEAAKELTATFGVSARRGQQFSGSKESPDVISDFANIHWEVKRCEAGNPYKWIEQATRDAGDQCPVVLHRRSNKPWLVIVRLTDVARLAAEISETAEAMGRGQVPSSVSPESVPAPIGQDGEHAGVL